MKFNYNELTTYCNSKRGKADKEGTLWLKERSEGLFTKRESYNKRAFRLLGNLLFYLNNESQSSNAAGVIILERSTVENDVESGNKNGFVIAFEDGSPQYELSANTAREAEDWIIVLQQATYQHLLSRMAELRGRLLQITGEDPLPTSHPLYDTPTESAILPVTGIVVQGEALLELSIACSSLVTEEPGRLPNSFVLTSCMRQPQAFWSRYAQTEIIESNCDPRFFTTVIFYAGHLSLSTKLKLEVFDVLDRREGRMKPIGQVYLTVLDLFQQPTNRLRREIRCNDDVRGYMVLRGRKASEASSPMATASLSRRLSDGVVDDNTDLDTTLGFSFDNICLRSFQFPVWNKKDASLQVSEVMGETAISLDVPLLLLDLYITEESNQAQEYRTLTGLNETWEIIRQEVMEMHSAMIVYYRDCKKSLQQLMQQGRKFKKSIEKDKTTLEFAPTNLHIQQMKVTEGEKETQDLVYEVVTVGCPTAYSLKYRPGGLIKWQTTVPFCYANVYSSHDSKTIRARNILANINRIHVEIHRQCDTILSAAKEMSKEHLQAALRKMTDSVNKLRGHSDVMLLNDALQSWQKEQRLQTGISKQDCCVGDLCHQLEQHVLCVEMRVDAVFRNEEGTDNWHLVLSEPVTDVLKILANILSKLQKAIYFLFLQEEHRLILEKIPIGIKGYRHRHDIVFSQALTTVVVSFILQLQNSILDHAFLIQLQDIGFLLHWESLLSTHGDEIGMLEDFVVVMQNMNMLSIKIVSSNDSTLRVEGKRYHYKVRIPLSSTLFRLLPSPLREGKEIKVCAVLLTQGINEQQTMADTFGDNSFQDVINNNNFQKLASYCYRFCDLFCHANAAMAQKTKTVQDLLESLRTQINSRKHKNTDVLSLSQQLCRCMRGGRVTSCKSAKDRTAMSVTLEQVHILQREYHMDPNCFQQALDAMRSQGTRLENALKNVNQPLYAFNALQVLALPKTYRPPDGTYKKLQT